MSLHTPLHRTLHSAPKPSLLIPIPTLSTSTSILTQTQKRNASLLRRPKRPYTFTQLVALSDGSTYLQRTTSPSPVQKSTKDTRNTPLWNPSSQKLLNVEADEAGRLRAFRERFGRGWDVEKLGEEDRRAGEGKKGVGGEEGEGAREEEEDNLMDLIGGYGVMAEEEGRAAGVRDGKERSGKGKGGGSDEVR